MDTDNQNSTRPPSVAVRHELKPLQQQMIADLLRTRDEAQRQVVLMLNYFVREAELPPPLPPGYNLSDDGKAIVGATAAAPPAA